MKTSVLLFCVLFTVIINQAYSQTTSTKSAATDGPNLTLYGRGVYPGDDTTYNTIKASGFNTVVLSSFYIRSNGDVYSGDDSKNPIIHNGEYIGNKDWLQRIASLKKALTSVNRIEILLEGRWYNQPPNTYDFISNWTGNTTNKTDTGIVTGTGNNSTLYKICKVFKDKLGVDAVSIDDESVYDSFSIIKFGEVIGKLGMHMTLCPFTYKKYWKAIVDGSKPGLIDAVYLQCYDGGTRNTPAPWHDSVANNISVYPIFLCRGAFDKCTADHNSKTPGEIKAAMMLFKKDYPALSGGAIWQMADVKNYIKMDCATKEPASGNAATVPEYLEQLKTSLQQGLQ